MRKLLCGAAVLGCLVVPTAAQARCRHVGCLQHEVVNLTSQVQALASEDSQLASEVSSLAGQVSQLGGTVSGMQGPLSADSSFVNAFHSCALEAPITQYGDPAGSFGYVWDTSGTQTSMFDTTGLDGTASGDSVGAWVLTDQCTLAGNPTAAPAIRGRAAPRTGLFGITRFLPHPR